MTVDRTMPRRAPLSPRATARIAGLLYLVNIITSLIAFSGKGSHLATLTSGLVATASYVGVTIVLYFLFKPVNARLSLVAALFSLAGCALGVLNARHLLPFRLHSLVFFGIYCLMVGALIFRSTFLPKFLGACMSIAGLGWLTFVSSVLAASVSPYHYIAGGIGEGLLTLWLIVKGVDAARWIEQARARNSATLPPQARDSHPDSEPYSYRSAMEGSTRVARRAGR